MTDIPTVASQPPDEDPSWQYYFIVRDASRSKEPIGIVRQRIVNGVAEDQGLQRDGVWRSSPTISVWKSGWGDQDLVPASMTEALAYLAERP